MGLQVMSPLFAVLAMVAVAGAVALASTLGSHDEPWRRLSLPAATVVAAVATAGSLYYSEVVGFTPCELCWFQRIAMYPLVVVLGVASVRRDTGVWLTGVVLAGIGLATSIWHVLIQQFPGLGTGSCSETTPCSARWVDAFGFVSIPVMAGAGFLVIIVLMLHARKA